MKLRLYKHILSSVFVLFLVSGQCQVPPDSVYLPNETVIVKKEFRADLKPVQTIFPDFAPYNLKAEKLPSKAKTLQMEYVFPNIDPQIKPIKFTDKRTPNYNDGWLKLGYGSLSSILADGAYLYSIENWFGLGISSFFNQVNDSNLHLSKTTKSDNRVYGHYFLNPNFRIHGEFNHNYRNIGLRDSSLIALDTTLIFKNRESHNVFDFNVGFHASPYEKLQLIYGLRIENSLLNLNEIKLNERKHKLDLFIEKRINPNLLAGLTTDVEYRKQNVILNDTSLLVFNINPSVHIDSKWADIMVGLNISQDPKLLFPIFEISHHIKKNGVKVYAQISSKSKIVGYNEFLAINAPVNPRAINISNYYQRKYTAGAVINRNKLKTDVSIGFEDHRNFYNYLVDENLLWIVPVVTDFTRLNTQLKADYLLNDWFSLTTSYENHFYIDKIAPEVSNLPIHFLELELNQVLLSEKLRLKQGLFYIERNEIIKSDKSIFLDPIIDLNASVEYQITDNFQLHLTGRNLINKRYIQYENYQSFGAQVIGGILFVF